MARSPTGRKFTELCHPRQGRQAAAGDPVLTPDLILDPRPSAEDDNVLDLNFTLIMIQFSKSSPDWSLYSVLLVIEDDKASIQVYSIYSDPAFSLVMGIDDNLQQVLSL